jgi:hypothetical protein
VRPVPERENESVSDDNEMRAGLNSARQGITLETQAVNANDLNFNAASQDPGESSRPYRIEDGCELGKTIQEQKKVKNSKFKRAKGGYKIGKQVSGNFVSYKIRTKGQHKRGRFGRR